LIINEKAHFARKDFCFTRGAKLHIQDKSCYPQTVFKAMRLKLYCNRFAHFKDALVCSVNCPHRTRCEDFALYYDAHRAEVDALVSDYFAAQRAKNAPPAAVDIRARRAADSALPDKLPQPLARINAMQNARALIRLEIKREMKQAAFIWIDKEDRAELIEMEEVLERAAKGAKPKHIFKVAQEMELRYQLVPRQRIEKAKRQAAIDAERAAARRARHGNSAASSANNNAPAKESTAAKASSEIAPNPRLPQRTRRAKSLES
jgi:hypothetical protein